MTSARRSIYARSHTDGPHRKGVVPVRMCLAVKHIPSVDSPERDDDDGDKTGGRTEDPNERVDLADSLNDLTLLAFAHGGGGVQEKSILLIARKLTSVGEERDEASGEGSPDDQHRGHSLNGGGNSHCEAFPFWPGIQQGRDGLPSHPY